MNDKRTNKQGSGEVIRLGSVAALALFAGAMLTEGCILVPFWRSLSPAEFFAWYAANDERLFGFFAPLTVAAALIAIATAVLSFWRSEAGRWPTGLAAVILVAVVAMFPLYFQRVNVSFAAGSIAAQDLPAELALWARWHWLRTGLSFVALGAALIAARRGKVG